MSRTRTSAAALLLAAAALLALAPPAPATVPVTLDLGRFTLSQDSLPVRVEDFVFQRFGDSLLVRAASAPWRERDADLRFDKQMLLVVDSRDFELIGYSSQLASPGDTLRRGITLARSDTNFTAWREHNHRGVGNVFARPPGRLYVLDAPLFTLFSYVGWTMQGRTFERRPIHVFVLGASDTLLEATVTDAGTQELTWNGRTVATRKLMIGDQQTTVEAWFTPEGHMLRLEQPRAGIRAERDAPAAEPRPATEPEPALRP
jgi:hypothetical protein